MTTTTTHALSPDQQAAHDAVLLWWRALGRQQTLTLGGYAGTGKTTTIAQIVATIRAEPESPRIAFCCFTGKASLVLRRKLDAAEVLHDDYCGTIHGLIYEPYTDDQGKLVWERRDKIDADLIILDEASMVDGALFNDLKSYGLPILAVGDHGQLPPVSGQLNLMEHPEIRLEKIHRQAEGNPIVAMSLQAREGKAILCGKYGTVRKVMRRQLSELVDLYAEEFDAADMVLCGTNATRTALNYLLRCRRGRQGEIPEAGEPVICLRNQRDAGIFNGLTGTLRWIKTNPRGRIAEACVDLTGGGTWTGDLRLDQFGQPKTAPGFEKGIALWDWAYAMTVHKSQGSEAPSVIVLEECAWMETEDLRRRWRYTAYTRAAERLLIIG